MLLNAPKLYVFDNKTFDVCARQRYCFAYCASVFVNGELVRKDHVHSCIYHIGWYDGGRNGRW